MKDKKLSPAQEHILRGLMVHNLIPWNGSAAITRIILTKCGYVDLSGLDPIITDKGIQAVRSCVAIGDIVQ